MSKHTVDSTSENQVSDAGIPGRLRGSMHLPETSSPDPTLTEKPDEHLVLADLLNLDELQRIQDCFANATGVATVITDTDSNLITHPSNFCGVCRLIQSTDEGRRLCVMSDEIRTEQSRVSRQAVYHQCLSCGFVDASAPIIVNGRHIANWLIGQANVMGVTRDEIRSYARRLHIEEDQLAAEYDKMPKMSLERFKEILNLHWLLARELSRSGYKSLRLARDVSRMARIEQELREQKEYFLTVFQTSPDAINVNRLTDGLFVNINDGFTALTGFNWSDVEGKSSLDIGLWADPSDRQKLVEGLKREGTYPNLEARFRMKDGEVKVGLMSAKVVLLNSEPHILSVTRDIDALKKAEQELRTREHQLRLFVEHTPAAVAMFDREMRYLMCSQKWHEVYGLCGKSLTGASHYELFPDAPADWRKAHERCLGGAVETCEDTTLVRADGTSDFIRWETHPWYADAGDIGGIMAFTEVITERKLAQAKAAELSQFPEANPNLVLSVDKDLRVLYFNPATRAMLGRFRLSEEQLPKVFPDGLSDIVKTCLGNRQGIKGIRAEFEGHIWAWSFHPVPDQDLVHCYAGDITDQIRRERELTKLTVAVEQSSNSICITDPNGVVEYVNPYFTAISGYSSEEIKGQPTRILKSGRHSADVYAELWRTVSLGKRWSGILQNRRKNGELYWERKTITPVLNERSEITHYLSVGEDITTELLTQRKLIESDKMSAVGTLAAGVAHEFKNYLGGIIGNASYSLEEMDTEHGLESAREALRHIVELGEKANDIAMSLLSYSKSRPEEVQSDDLPSLVKKTVALVEKELRIHSIELMTHFESVPPVVVSSGRIQQLVLNLLINARQAIGSDGTIRIRVRQQLDRVTLEVSDTGKGIPEEHIDRIFDPFFSTKGVWGKENIVGTGMGLTICKNIASEYNGELTVDSVEGEGSTFTLSLPVQSPTDEATASQGGVMSQPRVLLFTISDKALEKYQQDASERGVYLDSVNGIHGLPVLLTGRYDLIVCDAGFSGKMELVRMTDIASESGIPYIMINCRNMEYNIAELYDKAAANFRELPGLAELLTVIATTHHRDERA